tara:strand:- start:6191 stop:6820 length:630 start_codon:yes stop_codon:yes gene_type:complete
MTLARQINKATIANIARNNFAIKLQSMQPMDSMVESDNSLVLDFDTNVKTYITQPDSFLNINNEPGWRRYTPDLCIEYQDGTYEFAEVKPKSKTLSDKFKSKFAMHSRIVLERTGCNLKLLTEPEMSVMRLNQFRQLKAYYRFQLVSDVSTAVINYLSKTGEATLSALDEICSRFDVETYYPMIMLAHQEIRCVTDDIITRASRVEVAA